MKTREPQGFCLWWNTATLRYEVTTSDDRTLTTTQLTVQVTMTSTRDGMFCGVGVVRRKRNGGIWITA